MLQTKALYNLLRLNAAEDPAFEAESWALEDLRAVSLDDLFQRLAAAEIQVEKKSYLQFAESCDTPEGLTDLLLDDEVDDKEYDRLYLIVFEIWRRLLPEKPSLSIFCDELDHQISLYDAQELESDETVQDALANLTEILDENTDAGAPPQEVFSAIGNYCAHDIENFLYDYIWELLDQGNLVYASELIEDFSPYVADPIWFDFLRARLASTTDITETNRLIHQILSKTPELDLLVDVLRFLASCGGHQLFTAAVKKVIPLLETEEEFREILDIVADYYRRLDEDQAEEAIQKLMEKRSTSTGTLDPADPDLKILDEMVAKFTK